MVLKIFVEHNLVDGFPGFPGFPAFSFFIFNYSLVVYL